MIQAEMSADQIATFQMGTHPLLTASPVAYQLVNAAEMALCTMRGMYNVLTVKAESRNWRQGRRKMNTIGAIAILGALILVFVVGLSALLAASKTLVEQVPTDEACWSQAGEWLLLLDSVLVAVILFWRSS